MKVVFIGQKGIPARLGGIERHVEELTKVLASSYEDVEIFVYTRPNYTDKRLKIYEGVNLISVPTIPTKHLDAFSHTFFSIIHLFIFKRDVDIVHFQSIGPSLMIPFLRILKPKTKIVSTYHSQCYFHQKWGFFARLALKFGEFVSCKFPDKTIAISKGLVSYAKKKYTANLEYIPNGVPDYKFVKAKEITKKWGVGEGDYLVAITRLIKHKGLSLLVEAFSEVKTDKKLLIVGSGHFSDNYVKDLKELAQKDERIVFTGSQSGSILSELFSNSYLFLQPSEREGLSIALLEAMSYSSAILTSDIPENKEALGEGGFLFRSKDKESLKVKLNQLLNDSELAKSRKVLAKNRVTKEYDWRNIAKKTMNVYKELVVREKKINQKDFFLKKRSFRFLKYFNL